MYEPVPVWLPASNLTGAGRVNAHHMICSRIVELLSDVKGSQCKSLCTPLRPPWENHNFTTLLYKATKAREEETPCKILGTWAAAGRDINGGDAIKPIQKHPKPSGKRGFYVFCCPEPLFPHNDWSFASHVTSKAVLTSRVRGNSGMKKQEAMQFRQSARRTPVPWMCFGILKVSFCKDRQHCLQSSTIHVFLAHFLA